MKYKLEMSLYTKQCSQATLCHQVTGVHRVTQQPVLCVEKHLRALGSCAKPEYPPEVCNGYFEPISMSVWVCGPIRIKSDDIMSGLSTLLNANIFLDPSSMYFYFKFSKLLGNRVKTVSMFHSLENVKSWDPLTSFHKELFYVVEWFASL